MHLEFYFFYLRCEFFFSHSSQGLRPELLRGIYSYGFEKPSAIQQKAIVPTIRFVLQNAIKNLLIHRFSFFSGRDIIAQAQSGTGKTATFAIGSLQQLDYTLPNVQALILAPTRELATQIQKVVDSLGDFLGAKAYACIGGNSIRDGIDLVFRYNCFDLFTFLDVTYLQSGVHLVVGTPGRVLDLVQRGALDPSHIKLFILDEADEMLSRGIFFVLFPYFFYFFFPIHGP